MRINRCPWIGLLVGLLLWAVLAWITRREALGRYSPTGQAEVAAVVLSAGSVWLAVKNSVWTWPVGIGGTALYLYLFRDLGLFADAGLQVVYIVLGAVGLVAWLRRAGTPEQPEVERAGTQHVVLVLLFVAIGTLATREYLLEVGGSAPLWDALLTSGSLGAQYLLIRKRIENWYLWAVVDVGYVALFLTRGIYLSAVLYAVFLVMVLRASVEWRWLLAETRLAAREGV